MTYNDPLDQPIDPRILAAGGDPGALGPWAGSDDPDADENPSAPFPVPPIWRARLFLAQLILAALVALSTGLAAVWWPGQADAVAASGAAVLSALGILTGGLGIAYRQSPGVLR